MYVGEDALRVFSPLARLSTSNRRLRVIRDNLIRFTLKHQDILVGDPQ
jgi:hypothetical protein